MSRNWRMTSTKWPEMGSWIVGVGRARRRGGRGRGGGRKRGGPKRGRNEDENEKVLVGHQKCQKAEGSTQPHAIRVAAAAAAPLPSSLLLFVTYCCCCCSLELLCCCSLIRTALLPLLLPAGCVFMLLRSGVKVQKIGRRRALLHDNTITNARRRGNRLRTR